MTEQQRQATKMLFVHQNTHFETIIDYASYFDFLLQASADELFSVILENIDELESINTRNIPQFSEKRDMYKAVKVLIAVEPASLTYNELGYYLCKVDRKPEAKRKYAENQYMLAAQMGFAIDGKPLEITEFGKAFNAILEERKKDEIMKRMCLKVPVLQQILLTAQTEHVDVVSFLGQYLAPSTVLRRRSNIHTFLNWLQTISGEKMFHILNHISW